MTEDDPEDEYADRTQTLKMFRSDEKIEETKQKSGKGASIEIEVILILPTIPPARFILMMLLQDGT